MKRQRIWAFLLGMALAISLLAGCVPAPVEPTAPPTPEPTARPTALAWLHGFYAGSSYGQIGLADHMDAVSLGWGRMYVDETGAPYVRQTGGEGNHWVVPKAPEMATGYFDQRDIPYNLCVFATTAHSYEGTNVLAYLLTEEVREQAAEALVAAAEPYCGLTVDFEGLASAGYRQDFSRLMEIVREKLPREKPLYVAVPPDLWYQGYDYHALGEVCDKVILMAHDYQWRTAPEENLGTPSPTLPWRPSAGWRPPWRGSPTPRPG